MPQTREEQKNSNEDDGNFLSPEGMKLRSGRKKRRRSLETSGLTPEEKELKRQRTDANGLDASDDDLSANGGESESEAAAAVGDSEDQQRKMAANSAFVESNGKHAVEKVSYTASVENDHHSTERTAHEVHETDRAVGIRPDSQRPHVVEKLRMPSKHTPGKLRETARLPRDDNLLDVPPAPRRLILEHNQHVLQNSQLPNFPSEPVREYIPPRRARQYENGDHEELRMDDVPFHMRCYDYAIVSLQQGWERAKDLIALPAAGQEDAEIVERIMPALRQRVDNGLRAAPVVVHQLLDFFLRKTRGSMLRTNGWFLLFLVFQLFFQSFWKNCVWASTIHFSKVALLFYKSTIFSSQHSKQGIMLTEQVGSVDPEFLRRQEELLLSIEQHLKDVKSMQTALGVESAAMDSDLETFSSSLLKHGSLVEASKVHIAGALDNMDQALLESSIADSALLQDIRKDLGVNEDAILDVASVKLWDIPDIPACQGRTNSSDEEQHVDGVNEAELVSLESELEEEVRDAIARIKQSDEFDGAIRRWFANEIANFGIMDVFDEEEEDEDSIDTEATHTILQSSNLSAIKNMIQARLDLHAADQTGRVDYASIHNGARVIRHGIRATSPSLVDKLPVLNRVASLLHLRFYGFGPEAALTSTYPVGSLGQCWALDKDTNSRFSAFGTLSIRLAKPIYVRMISIEHPTREVTDRINTAVRSFRVVGFEDPDANGRAWNLGSFEYNRNGKGRQEFDVEDELNGMDVPKLSAISLDIDSNWGEEYACLYRVRVHGATED